MVGATRVGIAVVMVAVTGAVGVLTGMAVVVMAGAGEVGVKSMVGSKVTVGNTAKAEPVTASAAMQVPRVRRLVNIELSKVFLGISNEVIQILLYGRSGYR